MDNRDDKDWIQIWYKETAANVRWNKDQGWKAVQWTLALFAVIGAGARSHVFPRGVWCVFIVLLLCAVIGWLYALHKSTKQERIIGEGLVAELAARRQYLPALEDPEKWNWILIGKIVLLGVAAVVVSADILSSA